MTGPARAGTAPQPAAAPGRDPTLAAAHRLVEEVAPSLGLRPAEVRLRLGDEGRRALAFGARGLVEGGAAFLAADPLTPAGRRILVHELVHLAQQQGPPATGEPRGQRAVATAAVVGPVAAGAASARVAPDPEAEARAIAEAFVAGTLPWRPRARLDPTAVAADTGTATLPRPALERAPAAAAETETAADVEIETGQLQAELGRLVEARYADARGQVLDTLSGLWVSSGDVSRCLQILDPMPFLVAQALVKSLPRDRLDDLGKNLDDGHYREFPSTAVAALSALTPMSLRLLDASNVAGLDPAGFGSLQMRATIRALRGLRPAVLVALFTGERGDVFDALTRGATPGGDDRDALRAALRALTPRTVEEADAANRPADARTTRALARIRQKMRQANEQNAVEALQLLAGLAETPPVPSPVPPAGNQPTEPEAPTEYTAPPPPEPGRQLRLAVGALEVEGLIAKVLDALPGEAKRADSSHASQLLVVLAAREPFRTLQQVESLLSYGLFDWAITDAEARYAYLLVRSLSVVQQERWRRLDSGMWFQRLEENIPRADVLAGAYGGVGRRAGDVLALTGGQSPDDAALALVRQIDEAVHQGVDGPAAVRMMRRLLSVARQAESAERGTPRQGGRDAQGIDPEGARSGTRALQVGADRRRILEVAVARLDTLGDLDPILDALPDSYLLNELWRGEILEVLSVRDPRHLERHARRLLSRGLLDWAVTSREAWLAFQLVRNLSPEDQERFQREDPDRYDRITSEMTAPMRASASVTMISGRAAVATRDRLRRRLLDRAIWSGPRAVELRSLVIQLYALDDAGWVFQRSRDVHTADERAFDAPELAALVADLRLYHPPDRVTFSPEQLRAPSALADTLDLVGRVLAFTPYAMGLLLDAVGSMLSTRVELADVDLQRLQALFGGDLEGIRLRSASRDVPAGTRRRVGPQGAEGPRGLSDPGRVEASQPNRFSVWIIPSRNQLGLELPKLDLAGLLRTGPGWSLRTGKGTLTGLNVVVDYSDRHFQSPAKAVLDVTRVDITDIVLAKADSLIAATRGGFSALHLLAGQRDTAELTAASPPGTIPIPVIGPLVNLVRNYLELMGTLPGLSSAIGAATGPLTGGVPWLAQEFTSTTTGAAFSPIAESFIGLVTDGSFQPPRTVTQRVTDAAAMLRAVDVSFDDLTVEGLSFGGQQQVASISLRDVFLGVGLTRPAVLRRQIASITRRLDERRPGRILPDDERTRLQQSKVELEGHLAPLTALETELDSLEGRFRVSERSLSDDERTRMLRLSALVRQTAGGALDIASISVGPLSGQVDAAGVEIGAVHADAELPSLIGEYLPPEQRAQRFSRTGAGPTPADVARRGRAEAQIASVRLVTRPGEPALRVVPGALPDPTTVERELRGLVGDDPATVRRRTELEGWPQRLRRLRYLESLDPDPTLPDGTANRAFASAADLAEREQLRAEAQRFFGFSVDTLDVSGVTARLDPATTGVDLDVARLDVTGVRAGATRVARVEGEHVGAGLSFEAGAQGGRLDSQQRRRLRELGLSDRGAVGRVHADRLQLTDVERPGLRASGVTLQGVHGRVVPDGDDYALPDLHLDAVELTGAEYSSPASRIFSGGTTRLAPVDAVVRIATAPDRSPGAAPDARTLSGAVVESLVIGRVTADDLGIEGRQPAPGYTARITGGALVGVRLSGLQLDLAGERLPTGRLSIDQLEQVKFAIVSKAFEGPPSSTLSGTLDSPVRQAGRAAALEVDLAESGDRAVRANDLALTDGTLTTSSGTIRVRRLGLGSATVVLEAGGRIRFDDITVPNVDVSGVDWQAAGGRITASGSTMLEGVTAKGTWDSAPDRAVRGRTVPGERRLWLDHLHVDRIRSDDLHYRSGAVDLHLGHSGPGGHPPDLLDVRDVDLRELSWRTGGDLGADSGIEHGSLDVGRAAVVIGGSITEQLRLRAHLQAASMHATFLGTGGTTFRARGIEGDVGVTDSSDTLLHHASFVGVDTGLVAVHGSTVEIGPDGTDGLAIPSLVLDTLTYRSPTFGLRIPQGEGAIALGGVHARARLELSAPGQPGPPLRRLVLRQLAVDEIRATGVQLDLPGFTLALDKDDETTVAGLTVSPPAGEEGFVVEPTATGGVALAGRLDLGALRLPWVAADIGTFLRGNADLAADSVAMSFLRTGGMDVDVTNPRVEDGHAVIGAAPGAELFLVSGTGPGGRPVYGLSAASLQYESRPGASGGRDSSRVSVRGTELRNLLYRDPASGITVMVQHGAVPGTISHDIATGQGALPELDIDDAFFQLDLATLLAGPSTSSAARPLSNVLRDIRAALSPNARALRTLSGHVWATLETGRYDVPLDLRFTNGELDLQRAVSGAEHGVPALTVATEGADQVVLTANVPVPSAFPPSVTIEQVRLLSWHLTSGQVTHFDRTGRLDVLDLLTPSGWLLDPAVGGPSSTPGPAPSAVRLTGMHGDLSMHSTGRIPVDLGRFGTLALAPDAVAHLLVGGDVGGSTAAGGRTGLVVASLERVSVEESRLTFPGTRVDTDAIDVTDVRDVRLTFSGFSPQLLSGHITRAVAHGIRWRRSAP